MRKSYGILGWPVEHSMSPAMQGAAFEASGLDAAYLPFAVRPEALGDALLGVRALGIQGLNVTLPHKSKVLALLDEVDEGARAIGAVNTVVRRGEQLHGYNTDGTGLARAVLQAGTQLSNQRIVVLGAGGAARAAVVGLAQAGAAQLQVLARRPEQAALLCRELTPVCGDCALESGRLGDGMNGRLERCDLLVQSTSATLGDDAQSSVFVDSLPLRSLPDHAHVMDLVYSPRQTSLLRAAGTLGLSTIDGVGMLLHQGALAFELWTGLSAPIEVMRATLEQRLPS